MSIFPIEGKDTEDTKEVTPNEKRNYYIFLFVLFALFIAALYWIFVLT